MIRTLLWKEWRENAWRLVYAALLLPSFVAAGSTSPMIGSETMGALMLFIGGVFIPCFLCMGLITTDRGSGCHRTLLALPASPSTLLAVKAGLGAAGILLPFLFSAVLSGWLPYGSWPDARTLAVYAGMAGFGVMLFLWTLAFSVRTARETHVALLGILVLVLWIVSLFPFVGARGLPWFVVSYNPIMALSWMLSPMQDTANPLFPWECLGIAVVQIAILYGLWRWALRRYVLLESAP